MTIHSSGFAVASDGAPAHDARLAFPQGDVLFGTLFRSASIGVKVADIQTRRILDANPAYQQMLGYTLEELCSRPYAELTHPDDRAPERALQESVREGDTDTFQIVKRYVHKDRTLVCARVTSSVVRDGDGIARYAVSMVEDVSRDQHVEALGARSDRTELQLSQHVVAARVRQLETIAELGRDILAGLTFDHLLERVGSSVARALDIDRVSVLEVVEDGQLSMLACYGWEDGVLPDTVLAAKDSQAGFQVSAGLPRLIVEDMLQETRFVPSRTLLDAGLRGSLSCLIEGDDVPFGVLAAHTYAPRSFTEEDSNFLASVAHLLGSVIRRDRIASLRVESEEELRRTAERFRMIADNAQDVIYRLRVGDDAGYDYISPMVASILGVPPEDFYADPDLSLKYLHEDDVNKVADSRGADEQSAPLLIRWHHPDGRLLSLERRTTHFYDDHGKPVAIEGIIRDVTERVAQEEKRRSLEEQLRQSQKLEAIGQLAGGIAHDFNNLLLALRGYGDLALRRLERGDTGVEDDIGEMLDATDRAAALTNQLLAFARRQQLNPEVIDLCDVVQDMDKLLRTLIGDQVELISMHGDGPVLVEVDRSQLEQVIANLGVNARDAMPESGRLEIEVANDGAGHAVLSFADTGCGMDSETVARVFEPFFTTKGDLGTGLGLATVHGIVSQSGGRISVESAPGNGTTFRVFLPLAHGEPAQALRPILTREARGGAESILVVEDDPMVRSIVKAMLEDRGYNVVAVDGSEAAIATVPASPVPFDLVLTDLVMPGLTGPQTVERLRELGCEAKVLYMSGYANDALRSGTQDSSITLLQKPFDGEALARHVRAALDEGSA
jgi:PAS domain S-box-containing protein